MTCKFCQGKKHNSRGCPSRKANQQIELGIEPPARNAENQSKRRKTQTKAINPASGSQGKAKFPQSAEKLPVRRKGKKIYSASSEVINIDGNVGIQNSVSTPNVVGVP